MTNTNNNVDKGHKSNVEQQQKKSQRRSYGSISFAWCSNRQNWVTVLEVRTVVWLDGVLEEDRRGRIWDTDNVLLFKDAFSL